MKFRLLAATLAAFAALPALAYAASGVSTANVNMRSGPSTQYPAVVIIPRGMPIEVHGCLETANWCDVSFARGRGWVSGRYIQMTYGGNRVYVDQPQYRRLGIPTIIFNLDDYWGRNYRQRDFYRQRDEWRGGPDRRPQRPPMGQGQFDGNRPQQPGAGWGNQPPPPPGGWGNRPRPQQPQQLEPQRPRPPRDQAPPQFEQPRPPRDQAPPQAEQPRPPRDQAPPQVEQPRPPRDQAPPQAEQPRPPRDQAPPQAEQPRPPRDQAPPQAEQPRPPRDQAPPQAEQPRPPRDQAPPQAEQPRPPRPTPDACPPGQECAPPAGQ